MPKKFQHVARWGIFALLIALVGVFASPQPADAQRQIGPRYEPRAVSFSPPKNVSGETLVNPTSVDWGPDDRLYVTELSGAIYRYTVVRDNNTDTYAITATETINLVKQIPNYNDDGTLNLAVNTRQITGILVVGTASNPIVYVSSSDPRFTSSSNGFSETNLDTNSGTISRLTKNGLGQWEKVDIVRGMPRSEELHATNGMALDEDTNTLYVINGGHTNKGAPGNNFNCTPEYALSAALLSIDLNVINALPVQTDLNGQNYLYDIPTLDDPTRGIPGQPDPGDPFGGNDGLNQAMIVIGGPVQVYSAGYRNAYDVVLTKDTKRLYTFDNGPNINWGGLVTNEGAGGVCTNRPNGANSATYSDQLHYITGPGYYGGHPNPIRANPDGAGLYRFLTSTTCEADPDDYDQYYDFTEDWSPVPFSMADPVQCDFRASADTDSNGSIDDGSLAQIPGSTNGLAEYTASNFGGEMQGDLLAASYHNNRIYRLRLNPAGNGLLEAPINLFSGFGTIPLDVTAQGDLEIFPGTVWTVTHISNNLTVFEPVDFIECSGTYDEGLDEDFDGYTNADEIDNGTNPCSGGSRPNDNDGDFISDLNDPDDDNDLINDVVDAFAIDATNGLLVNIPVEFPLYNSDPGTGFFGLGFTGLMTNGVTDYLDQYDEENLTAGGATGRFTIDATTNGTALDGANNLDNGFQLGVNASTSNPPFYVETRLASPFFNNSPVNGQYQGMYIGTGDQSNYLQIQIAAASGMGQIQVLSEVADQSTLHSVSPADLSVASIGYIDLRVYINPDTGLAQAAYKIDESAWTLLGSTIPVPSTWLNPSDTKGLAIGFAASSGGSSVPFTATWDYIQVDDSASALVVVDPPGSGINGSTYNSGSFSITNTSGSDQNITSVTFDLNNVLLPDVVFDPDGTAGDTTAKPFTPDSGAAQTGLVGHTLDDPFDNGYRNLEVTFNDFNPADVFTFSIDVDPTSIQGEAAPGPGESGSISGFELIGSTVTVTFDDGSTYITTLYRRDTSLDGAQSTMLPTLPDTPLIEVLGIETPPTTVNDPNQTVRVTGEEGDSVRLLVAEGALFQSSGGGHDIDPYEANSIINIQEYFGTIGGSGTVDIPVTLTRTDNDEGGLNHIVAVISSSDGSTSAVSNKVVLEYEIAATATNTPNDPELTATAGGDTLTPSPTPSLTSTPMVGVELLVNGGFEAKNAENKPDVTPWVLKNFTSDKAKCNKDKDGDGIPDKIVAAEGECAVQFKGSVGESAKIQQSIVTEGLTFTTGDTLTLNAQVNATQATASGKFKVVVKYADDTKDKITADIAQTAGYQPVGNSVVMTNSTVTKMKINISHKSTAGKVLVDAVSLVWVSGDTARLIPIPQTNRLSGSNRQ